MPVPGLARLGSNPKSAHAHAGPAQSPCGSIAPFNFRNDGRAGPGRGMRIGWTPGNSSPILTASFMSIPDELKQLSHRFPSRGLFCVLLAAWVVLFHFLGNSVFGFVDSASLFRWHWAIWNGNPDEEFGMLVPILVAAILWIRRDRWADVPKAPWAPGLGLLVAGLVLHVVGYTIQQTRLSAFGFLIGLAGLTALLWGPALLRSILFPGFLLFFAIPFTGVLETLTFRLRLFVTDMSVGFCDAFLGMDVTRKGTLIYNKARTFTFDVAPACSGIRSLTAMTLLTVTYSFLAFASPWRRSVLILSALPLAVLGNIARLITVIVVSDAFGQGAGLTVENRFGFITFLVGLSGLFLLGRLLQETPPCPPATPSMPSTLPQTVS